MRLGLKTGLSLCPGHGGTDLGTECWPASATALGNMLRAGQISAREMVQRCLEAIDVTEPQVGAFLYLNKEGALAQAEALDRRLAKGEAVGALAGIPVALKDNICVKGMPATCGSRMLQGFVPPYTATAAERLLQKDALLVGKLNMDEFGMGCTGRLSYYKATKNPWDTRRAAGGSSSGPAAAVAARQMPLALGSDTGGSIRVPASYCGVVGLRPTYGAVPRYGLVAYASSMDQIGPIGRSVADVKLAFEVIQGRDAIHDATCTGMPQQRPPVKKMGEMVIGLPTELMGKDVAPAVRAAVLAAAAEYEKIGAGVCECSVPSITHALGAYYTIASAEAFSNLARYDGLRYGYDCPPLDGDDLMERVIKNRSMGFGAEVKRRLMLGSYVFGAAKEERYIERAQQVRRQLQQELAKAFKTYDALLCPTTPATAAPLDEGRDTADSYAAAKWCAPASLAGLPAISLPCGADGNGMPIGMQLIASRFCENTLFYLAGCFEKHYNAFEGKGMVCNAADV